MTPPRRKRRSQQAVRRTVLLVTNGRVTEYAYLSQLCRRVGHGRISAQVKVIEGDPLTVVKELSGPRSDLSDYREVWIVVDHDGRERHDFLKECRELSSRQTIVHGIVSVPCFEVWLLWHFEDWTREGSSSEIQHAARRHGLANPSLRPFLTPSTLRRSVGPHALRSM